MVGRSLRAVRSLVLASAGITLLVWMVARVGADGFLNQLRTVDPIFLALVASLVLGGYALRLGRWRLLYRDVRAAPGSIVYSIGMALNTFGAPGFSETVRSVVAQRRLRIPFERTLVASGLERLHDLLVLLALGVLALPLIGLAWGPWNFLLPAVLLGFGLVVLARPGALQSLSDQLGNRHRWQVRLGGFLHRVAYDLQDARRRPALLLGALAFSLAIWSLHVVAHWAFFRALGADLNLLLLAGALALSLLLGGLLMVPGGIGVRESSLAFLLVSQGVPLETAAAGAVVFRFLVDAITIFLGSIGLWAIWARPVSVENMVAPSRASVATQSVASLDWRA